LPNNRIVANEIAVFDPDLKAPLCCPKKSLGEGGSLSLTIASYYLKIVCFDILMQAVSAEDVGRSMNRIDRRAVIH